MLGESITKHCGLFVGVELHDCGAAGLGSCGGGHPCILEICCPAPTEPDSLRLLGTSFRKGTLVRLGAIVYHLGCVREQIWWGLALLDTLLSPEVSPLCHDPGPQMEPPPHTQW